MFGNAMSGWHLLLILAVVLLLFGASKLPALAKSVGQSARVLKREIRDPEPGESAAAADAAAVGHEGENGAPIRERRA